jgi:threonine/homoserine/homoserine lactone efflux protein
MHGLLGLSGLIFVSAITPGPNNIAMLRIAGEQGLKAMAAAILGVVFGSLALLFVTQAGLDLVATRHEWLRGAITVCGVGYLLYVGASAIYRSVGPTESTLAPAHRPLGGAWSLFAFQFANPKAWVLILTAAAAARRSGRSPSEVLIALVTLLTVIPITCLIGWALLGRVLMRRVQDARRQAWVARAMGMLLIASAASLIAS